MMRTLRLTLCFCFALLLAPAGVADSSSCTGLGDNIVRMGGGGATLQCSKYNTPGGGNTVYQLPDGTFCSFKNVKPDEISCGGSGTRQSSFSPSEFRAAARAAVARAYPGEDLQAKLSALDSILPGAISGSDGLIGAFANAGTEVGAHASSTEEDAFAGLLSYAESGTANDETALFFMPYDARVDVDSAYSLFEEEMRARFGEKEKKEDSAEEEDERESESTFGRNWRINDTGEGEERAARDGNSFLGSSAALAALLLLAAIIALELFPEARARVARAARRLFGRGG